MTEPGKGRERRRHARDKRKMQVRYGPGDLAHSGTTSDFSESGICLQAVTVYPPGTILVMKIELPEGTSTFRGIVRWSRDLSSALKRPPAAKGYLPPVRKNPPGGMGVEFMEALQGGTHDATARRPEPAAPESKAPAPPPKVHPRRGVPVEMSEQDLKRYPSRRRQISTMAGNTFEVHETEYRGALYVRIVQLPLTDGSNEVAFQEAFWTREEANAAVKAFLKGR